jgi:hypothetical protein
MLVNTSQARNNPMAAATLSSSAAEKVIHPRPIEPPMSTASPGNKESNRKADMLRLRPSRFA